MPVNKSRFVLLCQHSLAFGLVVAITAPAAAVVSLDIVAPPAAPSGAARGAAAGGTAAQSPVASRPVPAKTTDVALGGVSKAGLRALGGPGQAASLAVASTDNDTDQTDRAAEHAGSNADELAVLSAPQEVDGLATVGVTWAPQDAVAEEDILVSVRTKDAGSWSAWTELRYHPEEAPDPTSAEGREARPGTDPVFVGSVDDVQVKATTADGTSPVDMKLSLVDPGATSTTVEEPEIDPNNGMQLSAATATGETAGTTGTGETGETTEPTDDVDLSAGAVTAKPTIYSRAQWGADERMRDRSSLTYGEVHAGFVHHTVNANSYSRSQVPSVIRGIYAYHTQSRGWSDVGYNFLVDRFGRIWEGRAGGVDRPVVGAHTLGYNGDSFAMSAIGNYETARPSAALVDAYGRLMAWKLSLHGVRATSTRQYVTGRSFRAINGHRDAGTTACPGRYLYAQIPAIRNLADRYQRAWTGRKRSANLMGPGTPDLVVRARESRRLFVISTGGSGASVSRLSRSNVYLKHANAMLNVGDWNGDGRGDVVSRSGRTGLMYLYRGNGAGRFAAPVLMSKTSFSRVRLLTAVGDMTGDGRPDLLGQPVGGAMRIYPGRTAGFRHSYVAHSALSGTQQLGVGLWNKDGAPDALLRRSDGSLVLYPGNGPGGLTGGRGAGSVGRIYNWLLTMGDVTGDGRVDLVGRAKATGKLWLLPARSQGFPGRRSFLPNMTRFDIAG